MPSLEKIILLYETCNKVSYTDQGQENAPTIIFIHGFPLNKSMWKKQVEALEPNYRVITYDIRGHGNSEAGDVDFSIDLFAEDLLSLMDALKINKASLCGLSMGGYIALNAFLNHPQRFSALILCDTTCFADTPEIRENRMKTIGSIRESGVEKYADLSINKLFAPNSILTRKEEVSAVKAMIMDTNEQTLAKTLTALATRNETCTKLSEINLPVLIMVGDQDIVTPPENAQFINDSINGSLLVIVEQAGHLSNLENPEQFNNQLNWFLSTLHLED
ncbi:MAG: alpha/beta hydrolase [Bacteroidetes bacterium HGW-Bacteroidetes-15]|nr:MAG: alpha/beta hydrolase [Bacteroidetes bacterium HGW-Bacteroidetes-15]